LAAASRCGSTTTLFADHQATLPLKTGSIAEISATPSRWHQRARVGHLDLPEDVALAATNERVARRPSPRSLRRPDDAVARAHALIAAAKRPIAVIGSSAMRLSDPTCCAA
jgi:hypothetical protein